MPAGNTNYEFTDEMGEVSGFGDEIASYERACRDMVVAGAEWFDENPDSEPVLSEYESVVGIVEDENSDAAALLDTMTDAADGEPTGAMVHGAVRHVMYVSEHGWDAYVEMMESDDGA